MKLETKRLILRPLRKSDAASVKENIDNLNVSRWLLVVPHPYSLKDANFWIGESIKKMKKKKKEDYSFGIELKEEKKVIGGIGLHHVDLYQKTATVGYWLGENYWRKGYGSEALKVLIDFAFRKLKLQRLEAEIFEGNPSSGKLLEKMGFKKEGIKRKNSRSKSNGKFHDCIIYGLLRTDKKK